MNMVDLALQSVTPTVMVPLHGAFTPLSVSGHRFLAASDGLWLEVRRPWLHLVWPLALQQCVPMPYGRLEPLIDIARVPKKLLADFIEMARATYPLECGAWITQTPTTGEWRLIELEATHASSGALRYNCPPLADGEHLVVDLHSHGGMPAFFSGTDNADDIGSVKVSGVFGKVASQPESLFRLCANGLFITLGQNWGCG